MMVGNAFAEGKDLKAAHPLLEDSVRRFRALGDEQYALIAGSNLAWVAEDLGYRDEARILYEANLRQARALGNERMEAGLLAQYSMMVLDDGRLEDAMTMLQDAIRIEYRRGNILELAVNFGRMAAILAPMGRLESAAILLTTSESLTAQVGASIPFWADRRNARTLTNIRKQIDEAVVTRAQERGRRVTLEEAVELALGKSPQTRSGTS
jgi:tetratricopeptide (TPR) repeat protein